MRQHIGHYLAPASKPEILLTIHPKPESGIVVNLGGFFMQPSEEVLENKYTPRINSGLNNNYISSNPESSGSSFLTYGPTYEADLKFVDKIYEGKLLYAEKSYHTQCTLIRPGFELMSNLVTKFQAPITIQSKTKDCLHAKYLKGGSEQKLFFELNEFEKIEERMIQELMQGSKDGVLLEMLLKAYGDKTTDENSHEPQIDPDVLLDQLNELYGEKNFDRFEKAYGMKINPDENQKGDTYGEPLKRLTIPFGKSLKGMKEKGEFFRQEQLESPGYRAFKEKLFILKKLLEDINEPLDAVQQMEQAAFNLQLEINRLETHKEELSKVEYNQRRTELKEESYRMSEQVDGSLRRAAKIKQNTAQL